MVTKSFPGQRWQWLLSGWRQIDWFLFVLVVGITGFGGLLIYSTELNQNLSHGWQHWLLGGLGAVCAMMIARWRYEMLLQWHWLIYALTNAALIAVMLPR